MKRTGLLVMVEGPNDTRFVEVALEPYLGKLFHNVRVVEYAQMPIRKRKTWLRAMRVAGWSRIYLADLDDAPCITEKKRRVLREFGNEEIAPRDLAVVVKEIEGWYLAGVTKAACRGLRVSYVLRTEEVVKSKFLSIRPRAFDSAVDFMEELLRRFSLPEAKRRSASFRYFARKCERRR